MIYLALSLFCADERDCEAGGLLRHLREFLRGVGFPMTLIVGVGFWTLSCVSPTRQLAAPWTMFQREDFPSDEKEALRRVTRLLRPSWHPVMAVHLFVIQLCHTAMPIYPWVEELLFPEPPSLSPVAEFCATISCCGAWILWAMTCWHFRGRPPYPVMRAVWRDGSWPDFYMSFFILGLFAIWASQVYRNRN